MSIARLFSSTCLIDIPVTGATRLIRMARTCCSVVRLGGYDWVQSRGLDVSMMCRTSAVLCKLVPIFQRQRHGEHLARRHLVSQNVKNFGKEMLALLLLQTGEHRISFTTSDGLDNQLLLIGPRTV